ncbi:MAG: two-component LuxR family transcriptional regulator [Parcubacteria group bacterium Gr01-1014_31]|nr:MAG: two-component LuxR family transcriptional regulator [Parcubacteria group bacterium Gr01-1014_31]
MPRSTKKVLVIEDDKNLVRLLKDALEGGQYTVSLALDWKEAKSHLQKLRPDIILLDILLPGESGFDVLRQLKAHADTKNIPVVILSNLGQEQEIRTGMDLGAVDYLVKADIAIDQVVHKVQQVLKGKRA